MHQLEPEADRRFKTCHAKRCAVKFHVFERGLVRRVVGGDGVNGAVREAGDERVAVFSRSERRIHLVARVVLNVFVGERKMVRRHFASNAQALRFGGAHEFQRRARRKVRDMQATTG